MNTRLEKKRQQEKQIVQQMIALYCAKKHGTKGALCPDCQALLNYSQQRAEKCPFMENKTFCSACPVHCYRPEMRQKIREVMKFSGPRMLLYHPVLALRHVAVTMQEKMKQAKNS